MSKLNKAIAIGAALVVIGFIFYGNLLAGLFTNNTNTSGTPTINTPNMNITTGVNKEDVIVGQGATALKGDSVTVHYTGTLVDGKVFDSSKDRGQPFTFNLGAGQVIKGWDEGVAGMKVGGTRKLTIAPDFAYGDKAVGPIPANSTLIFTVELLSVKKP